MKKLGLVLGGTLAAIAIAMGCSDDATPAEGAPPGEPIAPPVSKIIGPAGGFVANADGARIDIPAGALTADTTITVVADPAAALAIEMTSAGIPALFEPDGLELARPAVVTLPVIRPSPEVVLARAPKATIAFEPAVPTTSVPGFASAEIQKLGVVAVVTLACAGRCQATGSGCVCTGRCLGVDYTISCVNESCTCQNGATSSAICEEGTITNAFRDACRFPGRIERDDAGTLDSGGDAHGGDGGVTDAGDGGG